jgi:hypothetical protein
VRTRPHLDVTDWRTGANDVEATRCFRDPEPVLTPRLGGEHGSAAVALVALVLFAWGLFSARLGRADLSAPIVFVTVGLLLSEVLHLIELALLGTRLPPRTVAFIGWFGPRGLASIIFAVLALEELHTEADRAVAVIGITVLLSVFADGLSAKPLASRYGESFADATPRPAGGQAPPQIPVRGLLHSHPAAETTRPGAGSAD